MDNQIVRLLSMAVSVLLCLVAFGTALRQESQSMSYIEAFSSHQQAGSMVQTVQNYEILELSGYEIIGQLAHQLRNADVQIDNSPLYFTPITEEIVQYTVNGVLFDTWDQLKAIPLDKKYIVTYVISPVERITQIDYISE